jgi:putative chitinase
MLTKDMLVRVCRARGHKPLESYLAALTSPAALALYDRYGISADVSVSAAFLANVCHETGGLELVRENPNYSAKNLHRVWGMWYGVGKKGRDGKVNRDSDGDGLSDLAEEHGGKPILVMSYNYNGRMGNRKGSTDGYDFRGAGPLQATGRDMYEWLEKETGIPFASKPKTIEDPQHWALVACLTFTKAAGNLCTFAQAGNFEAVCKGINCGSPKSTKTVVGMADRLAWFKAWQKELGASVKSSGSPAAVVYRFGSPKSDPVEAIQRRLNALMYGEGKLNEDGVFLERTRSAVTDFQMENGLSVDGEVGPKTWAALFAKEAKCYPPPASAQLGVAGLRKAGDPQIKAADNDRAAAATLGGAGAVTIASNIGALDGLADAAKSADGAQSALTTLVKVIQFGAANVLPIIAVVAAFLLWRRYGATVWDRVERWSRPPAGASDGG